MAKNTKGPKWITFTGQSGCGKGTAAEIAKRLCKAKGIKVITMSTGDNIRTATETNTYIAKKMPEINNQGKRQEAPVSFALDFNQLLKKVTENSIIIAEGSPRSVEQFEYMQKIVPSFIPQLKVIEVLADEKMCFKRLWERTKKDKRIDLSVKGKPGVPSRYKIKTKMSWWNNVSFPLMHTIQNANMYYVVGNIGTLKELEEQIKEILFS